MDASLKITSSDLPAEDLQDLTRDLSRTLNEETNVRAALPEEPGGVGSRGGAIELGQILLTALSSGTVVALFNVFRSYFERKPSLEMEFHRADGEKFRVRAEHLRGNQLNETIRLAKEFFEGSG